MKNLLPIAVVAGSGIIGAGLYFGLQTSSPGTSELAAADAAQMPGLQTPKVPSDAADDAVASQVRALVLQAHPNWKVLCWDTANTVARKAGRYTVALAFSSEGRLVVYGFSEERGASDPSVAQCLRQQVLMFTIPAPGHPVSFEVPFVLP